ncbi:hypothetical protein CPB86DRAFT_824234 [Serendipita vermifera]|nr:hypothetical protein CPB86DRAFT_824234 [Serendipita vermifera]
MGSVPTYIHDIMPHNIIDHGRIKHLPWGVQWELARLIQSKPNFQYKVHKLIMALQNVRSTVEGMKWIQNRLDSYAYESRTAINPLVTAQERKLKEPWSELDGESGTNVADRPTSAHCGRVHFRAHLERYADGYQLILDPPMLAASSAFLRKYGSDSMIRVRLPGKEDEETENFICDDEAEILKFFQGKIFYLFDRAFGMCALRDDTVVLFHDTFSPSKPVFNAIYDLWNRHNPLNLNQDQSMGKWASRLDLGFSSTVPIVQLDNNRVRSLGDFDGQELVNEKLPANQCMTDGCGYVNKELMRLVRATMGRSSLPTAIQFRIRGCKGMALIRPDQPGGYTESPYDSPTMWIRPSQEKISYLAPQPDQVILEVVGVNYLSTPARLGAEMLINLEYNGVPAEVFSNLNRSNMQKIYDALTAWTGYRAMPKLWDWISRKGGVLPIRLNRLPHDPLGSEVNKIRKKLTPSNKDGEPLDCFTDLVSGCPVTLYESAMTLIGAGFTPQDCPHLVDRIERIMKKQFDHCTKENKLEVPMSAMVHIAPVPEAFKDLLGEGEIHFLSSTENLLQPTGELASVISGEALIARYPCKVPSDFQKVKIVNRPELSQFVNIVLLPIVSYRSLASLLSGGDYDGDQVLIIWQPEILNYWIDDPSNIGFSNLPPDFSNNFEAPPTLEELLSRYPSELSDRDKRRIVKEIQNTMLSSISIQKEIGMYCTWHEKAAAKYGYGSPEAIRLAHMQLDRIDSVKTGKRVRPEVLERDKRDWQYLKRLAWKSRPSDSSESQSRFQSPSKFGSPSRSQPQFQSQSQSPPRSQSQSQSQSQFWPSSQSQSRDYQLSVMDRLVLDGKEKRQQLEREYRELSKSCMINIDNDDLCRPWREEERRVRDIPDYRLKRLMQEELDKIRHHVEGAHRKLNAGWSQLLDMKKEMEKDKSYINLEKQKLLRAGSLDFASGPFNLLIYRSKNLDRLRASYLYYYDLQKKGAKGSGRPWELAMKDLCDIKAEYSDEGKVPMAHRIAQFMQVEGLL